MTLRKRIAGWFGQKEHWFALILGLYLGGLCLYYQDAQYYVALVLWLLYHGSHKLEKTFYGKNGYR